MEIVGGASCGCSKFSIRDLKSILALRAREKEGPGGSRRAPGGHLRQSRTWVQLKSSKVIVI